MNSQTSSSSHTLSELKENEAHCIEAKKEHILFVSYDGLLDPLGQSQILPYIFGLRSRDFRFSIISFEKDYRESREIEELGEKLLGMDIEWFPLKFSSGGGAKKYLKRIVMGTTLIWRVGRSKSIDFVHLRGFVPAFMFKLAFLKKAYIYDYRSFAVDELAEAGVIKLHSLLYRFLKTIDRTLIQGMSALVVLEKSAKTFLREIYPVPDVPVSVIRTSTDCSRYTPKTARKDNKSMRFVHLGGVMYPYQVSVVLEFVRRFSEVVDNTSIHFFNEGQHEQLAEAINNSSIDKSLVFVEAVKQGSVPKRLSEFDAGLIFIDPSPCRRVCSPTKFGEYLAAGLPVIGGKGIEVLNEIEHNFNCALTIEIRAEKPVLSEAIIMDVEKFIYREGLPELCQRVARSEFDIDAAVNNYFNLYNSLSDSMSSKR
jgi:glycosyltransferase involved in cell wall biosynthesis